jgi:threonine dehydrogenase-like Zn-dependent dehydrogenase
MRKSDFDPGQINADVVIEAVGLPDAVETALRCCRVGGRVILLGSSRGLTRDIQLGRLVQERNLTIVGAHISDLPEQDCSPGRLTYRVEGKLFLDLLASGRLSVTELVTWRAAPDECNAVFELLAKGGGNQVAMVFNWLAGRPAAEQ